MCCARQNPRLSSPADCDEQHVGEPGVVTCGLAAIAVAVVRRKFRGVPAGPLRPAIVFEEEAVVSIAPAVATIPIRLAADGRSDGAAGGPVCDRGHRHGCHLRRPGPGVPAQPSQPARPALAWRSLSSPGIAPRRRFGPRSRALRTMAERDPEASDARVQALYRTLLGRFGLADVDCPACARALLPEPLNFESYTYTTTQGARWTWNIGCARALVGHGASDRAPTRLEPNQLSAWLSN